MTEKGYGFVREPGLSPRDTQYGQESPVQQMEAGVPKDDAQSRLARQHDTMLSLWGPGYEKVLGSIYDQYFKTEIE